MRYLASVKVRIFLVCWVIFTIFFATNVVREHYPAFALIQQGNFRCDRFLGFHDDIFRHTDGHSYIGNNVLGSAIAAVPLLLFDPVLDELEWFRLDQLAKNPAASIDTTYRTKHPNRQKLFRKVKLAGLDLRFGASTAITSALLMAPLSALMAVLMFWFLRRRGVAEKTAVWLSFLFAFGTPIFFRTAHLNHNMFLMEAAFGAFLVMWDPPGERYEISRARVLWFGGLCGVTFALDYAGAIAAGALWLYFVSARKQSSGWGPALKDGLVAIVGGLPGLLFLLGTQWWMYGNPFIPGQFVMPAVNYTDMGMKGLTWPTLEVYLKNFFAPGYGLFTYGPLLAIAVWPTRKYADDSLILCRRDRRFVFWYLVAFITFCAMNQYSMMQFNSGFRYLLPVVPFMFLQATDHLVRMSKRTALILSVCVIAHSTVLSMTREVNTTEKRLRDEAAAKGISEVRIPGYWRQMLTESPIPMAYRRVATEGPQLPWLKVLSQTSPQKWLRGPVLPSVILILTLMGCFVGWRVGERYRGS